MASGGSLRKREDYPIDRSPTLSPMATGSQVSDSRHGHSGEAPQEIQAWSPTRLQDWLRCPRRGWLSRELGAEREELQGEDIDNRTYGELLHNVHHDIIAKTLGFETSVERSMTAVLAMLAYRDLDWTKMRSCG